MESRKSFVFYKTFYESIECLNDELQLKFYRAITRYALFGEEPDCQGLELSLFRQIKKDIDIAQSRYAVSIDEGKKGGRPGIDNNIKKAIENDLQSGVFTQSQIAQHYNVSRGVVYDIKKTMS